MQFQLSFEKFDTTYLYNSEYKRIEETIFKSEHLERLKDAF